MPNLTINGVAVSVPEGTTILAAAKQVGIHIPHYCYHTTCPSRGTAGCAGQVGGGEVRSSRPPVPTVATEGMVVRTDTEGRAQGGPGCVEFL
jgi:NADH dehydrogenase/NADH:ubiquinone oxidoreductase subunit G